MFHLMGLRSISYSAILGITLSVFRPSKPPIFASPDAVLNSSVATSASRISCPPAFVESWATDQSDVKKLKQFDWIMFGGGPLQSSTGDMMAQEGVNLMPTLGLTEVGPITSYFPRRNRAEEWNWFTFSPFLDLKFVKEEGHVDDVYRMIVKKNAFKTPAVLNTNIEGVPAYDTKDLYIKHPTNPELWKIIGRSDDLIMHSTGVKTNPNPIEAELQKSPEISHALMFGRAKFQAGVLIFPAPDHALDTEELENKEAYIERIWPTIVNVNTSSPQHSRIFKETIIIACSSKYCEYTSKGLVRRAVTLDKYKAEIDAVYRTLEVGPQNPAVFNGRTLGRMPDFKEVRDLVKASVFSVLDQSVRDEDDIFQAGVDSLCALSIRNLIVQRLRSSAMLSKESIQMLPRDILYVLSSISKLSAFVYGVIHFDTVKGEKYPTARKETKNEAPDNRTVDEKWQIIIESKETVVKIVEDAPAASIPLIVLHGASGTLETFPAFQRCTSSIWAIQITDEAPDDSIEALALFYYHKIKASRPSGPYRLASYSGSCVILVEIVMIFQRNNDQVVQFDMLDHFPTYYFPELNPDLVQLDNPEWFEAHIKHSLQAVMGLISRTEGELSATAALRSKELEDAFNGGSIQPATKQLIKRVSQLIRMSLSYLMSDRFMEASDRRGDGTQRKHWSPTLFRSFVSSIRPRLAVYVAKEGIRVKTPMALMDEFGDDLGAKILFPEARVLHFEGGHLDFLGGNDLLKSIQNNFS
ncbi:hypothetical protein HYPSUDRAFT_215226 [Hypholoma sublateritium FD-334 SS-4]|uniref:Carrier domain-containing protein n=1 Tax=Hypholoma sublateritium (strain FD-334 SS-4) TaxID=945553 RepID=A0A0D2NXD5_HYPSF|nr:hypothetical protein HYPSUDRAFT_215226 [Hypholoma sublateritium FD-334 SS-4]